MKRLLILFGFVFVILGLSLYLTYNKEVEASTKYWICHCEPKKGCESLYLDWNGAYNGHIKKHDDDYWGKCVEPSPTPTPTPEPSVTPTPTPEPTETPEPTPTPTPEPEGVTVHLVLPEPCHTCTAPPPQCTDTAPTQKAENFHVYRNGDTAVLKWWPTAGDEVNIYYKQNDSPDWQYSVFDVPNTGYYEVHGLGTMDITFAIQQVNGCAAGDIAGEISQEVVDGPTTGWVLFR